MATDNDLPPQADRRLDVVVIEDNDDGRESMRLMLSACGLAVEAAADGAAGVALALESRPRAAVVDINLPVLDGLGVARELRRALGRSILLIAHTALASEEDRERARLAGFDCLLRKPCELGELLRLLARA